MRPDHPAVPSDKRATLEELSIMMRLCAAITFVVVLLFAAPARAASTCDPDRFQASGSIYRICMPDPADYNGIW